MARIVDPSPEQERGYRDFVASRPPAVRGVAERFDPWSLYRLGTTGQRVTIASFYEHEDGTVTLKVNVLGAFNLVAFERQVFGINPDDLTPCALPGPDEPVGAALTADDVKENIDALRVMARPDLWVMGEDGKARRKEPATP